VASGSGGVGCLGFGLGDDVWECPFLAEGIGFRHGLAVGFDLIERCVRFGPCGHVGGFRRLA
jgi:hypothetical protein